MSNNNVDIASFINKARIAFSKKLKIETATNLANAININPDDESIHQFIKEISEQLDSKEFDEFNHFLNGILKIQTTLRDQSPAEASGFKKTDDIKEGLQTGYYAIENASKSLFLIKSLNPRAYNSASNEGNTELLSGDLYSLLIYNRAPKIALVPGNALRSKIFPKVMKLSDFLRQDRDGLKKIYGFEKVMAACQLLGEVDFHLGNLMVRPMDDGSGRFELLKIDHGKSFRKFPGNFKDFIRSLLIPDQGISLYRDPVANGKLTFNIHEYARALNDMLIILSDDKVDAIIKKRIDEIRKINRNFNYDTDSLKEHISNMRRYAKILGEISKKIADSEDCPEKQRLENGLWLKKLDKLLKSSPGDILEEDTIEKLITTLTDIRKPQKWDENTINDFFNLITDLIKPNSISAIDSDSIMKFLKEHPTENLQDYSNADGKNLIEHLMDRFGHRFYESDLVIIKDIYEDVNHQDSHGNTVAMNAARSLKTEDDVEIIRKLLHDNLLLKNDDGKTILDILTALKIPRNAESAVRKLVKEIKERQEQLSASANSFEEHHVNPRKP